MGNPYTYEDPLEVFVGIVRHETGHPDLPFDYIYGPVSGLEGWEQFTFKSRRAFDVLNASVMRIHRVSSEGTLELIEQIVR